MTGVGTWKTDMDIITVHTALEHHGIGADITIRSTAHTIVLIGVLTGVDGITVHTTSEATMATGMEDITIIGMDGTTHSTMATTAIMAAGMPHTTRTTIITTMDRSTWEAACITIITSTMAYAQIQKDRHILPAVQEETVSEHPVAPSVEA